jgi:hypothetical protein
MVCKVRHAPDTDRGAGRRPRFGSAGSTGPSKSVGCSDAAATAGSTAARAAAATGAPSCFETIGRSDATATAGSTAAFAAAATGAPSCFETIGRSDAAATAGSTAARVAAATGAPSCFETIGRSDTAATAGRTAARAAATKNRCIPGRGPCCALLRNDHEDSAAGADPRDARRSGIPRLQLCCSDPGACRETASGQRTIRSPTGGHR